MLHTWSENARKEPRLLVKLFHDSTAVRLCISTSNCPRLILLGSIQVNFIIFDVDTVLTLESSVLRGHEACDP